MVGCVGARFGIGGNVKGGWVKIGWGYSVVWLNESYHFRFIENFSKIAKSLTILTQKSKTFDWGEETVKFAFQNLKDNLCNAPVPSSPQ
ncbi:hypothetical protein Tco_1090181 [Tanacetum coccineum]|uniref:Reverse transcriptase/retrotransposon-derived protein RNase H-like domain-containing protein n=1 Tax=Tanacetum coccineum TaxID=301880 RepID=A0ABQ5I3M3_9ASTR